MTRRKAAGTRKNLPQISEAEWLVMRVIWQMAPITTNEVVEALAKKARWKPKTIHTLLSRLAQKGAVVVDKTAREYVFCPKVTAEECEHAVSQSFLRRFFDGDLAPFLARFVERENLTTEEIEALKRILEKKEP